MFKPDDLEPKYKPRPVQQQRQIQETVHRPKPRVYQGNGVSFEVNAKSFGFRKNKRINTSYSRNTANRFEDTLFSALQKKFAQFTSMIAYIPHKLWSISENNFRLSREQQPNSWDTLHTYKYTLTFEFRNGSKARNFRRNKLTRRKKRQRKEKRMNSGHSWQR